MQCTCFQLALVPEWLVALLKRKRAWQLVGTPADARKEVISERDAQYWKPNDSRKKQGCVIQEFRML